MEIQIPYSKFRCNKCKNIFQSKTESGAPLNCPKCKSEYFEWLNYKEIREILWANFPHLKKFL